MAPPCASTSERVESFTVRYLYEGSTRLVGIVNSDFYMVPTAVANLLLFLLSTLGTLVSGNKMNRVTDYRISVYEKGHLHLIVGIIIGSIIYSKVLK